MRGARHVAVHRDQDSLYRRISIRNVGQTIECDAKSPMLRCAMPMLQEAASDLLAHGVSIRVMNGVGLAAEPYGGRREVAAEATRMSDDGRQ